VPARELLALGLALAVHATPRRISLDSSCTRNVLAHDLATVNQI
jgi:hypothetical protein